ncbi:MAG: hypothetical protein GXP26_16880 [Planctomycetes bacterium]|nr:hypothetical protein [Planctomycetota bacterium]
MPNQLTNALVLGLLCTLQPGCKPQEEISTYTIPRTTPPRQPMSPQEVANQLDHMVAAIVPQGDQAWFFKLTGSATVVDRHRDSIIKFFATVTLDESGKKPPTWKTPEGWEERPASEMRLATLVIPDKDGPLELSVSGLPLSGDWDEYLTSNVNRWLGQLKQGPMRSETVKKLAKEIPTNGAKATFFELVGIMQRPAGANPHAGMAHGKEQPPAARPQEKAPANTENAFLDFDTPEGWLPGRMSTMRKAAFRVVVAESEGEVTVIDLPTSGGGQVADVEANMLRWAGQVGLATDAEAIGKLVRKVTVDGAEGSYAELMGPEGASRHDAMLVAMIEREGKVWFIKMSGPSALVTAQKEAFREFLDSIRFK